MPPPLLLHVLVIENDAPIQQMLSGVLTRDGLHPLGVGTLSGGATAARQHPLGAIVLDLVLREREPGLEFVARIRQQRRYARIPILILTSTRVLREDDAARCRRYRADVFYKSEPITLLLEYLGRLSHDVRQSATREGRPLSDLSHATCGPSTRASGLREKERRGTRGVGS
jgi:two-component system OmpR family response regulator